VGVSTAFAMLIGIPLGIVIAHRPRLNKPVLAGANIIQTIPSLALFGFLLPVPWLGERADRLAILALTLYALLPIIRNTYTGITGVDSAVLEAGRGMGLTDSQLLFQVELPLALSVILSGVRIAIVVAVGLATIAAAIGAGGLGEFIAQQIEHDSNLKLARRFYLPATYICQQAILSGRIDIYPEYTGTALTSVLKERASGNRKDVYQRVKGEYQRRFGLTLGPE